MCVCVCVGGVYLLSRLRVRNEQLPSMVLENIRSHGNKNLEAHNKLLVQFVLEFSPLSNAIYSLCITHYQSINELKNRTGN